MSADDAARDDLSSRALMAIERELAAGAGATYRRILAADAVVVVPGAVLTAEECVAAMDASPGWDEVDMTDVRHVTVAPGCASVVYTFTGRRGETTYRATLASTYALRDGARRLVLHQQTPLD